MLDEHQFYIVYKYGVDVHDFENHSDVFSFIHDYVKSEGTTPDYRTVVEKFEDFEYEPEIADTFKYLCKQLKARTGKRMAFEMLQHRAKQAYKTMAGDEFVKWLREETEKIDRQTSVDYESGTNYATNGEERLQMYEEAKDPNNHVLIPTPFNVMNDVIGGGWELGEYLMLLAFTNVGKSWYASKMGLHAWTKGFGVLHYSPELTKRQQLFRLDTLAGQFDNQKMRRGKLGEQEGKFKKFLEDFNPDKQKTPYIVKTMEDLPVGLSLDVLEADLQMNPDIKFVIIDGFNLMTHEKADSTRNKMTATSRRLRQIFGKYKVTGLIVHQTSAQSQKEKAKEDEDGMRIISPPELTDFSETSATIQDSSMVMTLDAYDGIAKLAIKKAREPRAIGKIIECVADFNNGIIKEQSDIQYF
ncbi:AAA family ATPase protein [Bacillus phage PK2]|nr:AAA family ATPase protein [Bacillus phage PK2]